MMQRDNEVYITRQDIEEYVGAFVIASALNDAARQKILSGEKIDVAIIDTLQGQAKMDGMVSILIQEGIA
jgi:hypothetical protein